MAKGIVLARATRYLPAMFRLIGFILAATLWITPGDARDRRNPETVSSGVVRAIVDGDTLVLRNGSEVRLIGIQAPKLPLGRRGFKKWPLAEVAKQALSDLTLGKKLSLRYDGTRVDRHGRLLANLIDANGAWIQGKLVARGMARVYSFRDNRTRAAELLAIEKTARRARLGIWRHRYYRVIGADKARRFIDTFQLIEGRVLNTAVVRGRAYLNFGKNWRTDFTITIAPRHLRLFRRLAVLPEKFDGRRVRVRGWLRSYNGPLIEATHPEQIELLEK